MRVTVPFLALLAFLLLADQSGAALCGVFAAALHECGHLLAMFLERRPVRAVCLTVFGAEIRSESAANTYWKDALVFLAGPAVNLCAFLLLSAASPSAPFILRLFAAANGLLGAFNLLPVEPLDGGQALFCALQGKFSRAKSFAIVQVFSFLTVAPLMAAGLLMLFRSRWNFTLLLAAVYLFSLLVLKQDRA